MPAAMAAAFEAADGRPRRSACSPRSTAPRRRAATSAAASRPRCSSSPGGASRGRRASTCASRTTLNPLAEMARLLAPPARLRARGPGRRLPPPGSNDEAGRAEPARRRARPRLRRAALLGRARRRPHRRPRRRRGAGPPRRAAPPGMAAAARPAIAGLRAGGRRGPAGAGPVAGSSSPRTSAGPRARRASAAASARRVRATLRSSYGSRHRSYSSRPPVSRSTYSCVRVRSPAKRSPPPCRRRAGPSIRMSRVGRAISRNGWRRKPNSDSPSGCHGAVAPAAARIVGRQVDVAHELAARRAPRNARPAHQQRHADRRLVGQHLARRTRCSPSRKPLSEVKTSSVFVELARAAERAHDPPHALVDRRQRSAGACRQCSCIARGSRATAAGACGSRPACRDTSASSNDGVRGKAAPRNSVP